MRQATAELQDAGPQYASLAQAFASAEQALRGGKPGPALMSIDDAYQALEKKTDEQLASWEATCDDLQDHLKAAKPAILQRVERAASLLDGTEDMSPKQLTELAIAAQFEENANRKTHEAPSEPEF